ncbi:efflux RND transporter periplasmic adaptor subunit [Taibaiella chishuiensis]|uniref:Membrane fusion protein (Multidrug efflux system) n=1 Tax=Taibaiella chishuiensis TaxID=1434707 RepID=A0A2P8D346_9BACT|nr:efflux RND transporter periplasmic adaptor subunit [Taibaiella chishuiensis]PSK91644.1 membrane fusion protein (multidrug efflux system) [Taibaiella chishuiensis]
MTTSIFATRPILATTAIFLSVLGASCSGSAGEQAPATADKVDFIEIAPAETPIEKRYPGAIEGSVNVDIKAQVTGYLDQIYVKEGDYVKKGQSLFRLKGDVYNEQVSNSKAAYDAALAAQQNARIEVEKIRPLVEGKVYSELQLQTAEASLAAAKAQVAQARAALGSSQVNAAFTLITAPVNGYIGRIPNRTGNLVTPADATPLTTLSDIEKVYVYFSLSEADFIAFLKDRKADEGMNTVSLVMADGSVYDRPGTIELASGNIDRGTGSMALKAIFPNPDKILRSGGSGKIVLTRQMSNALAVPMGSVKDIQDRYFVFVLSAGNKVAMRPVEVSGKSGNQYYVIKSGLQAGDKVALNRIDALNDGTPVVPAVRQVTERK